MSPLEAILCVGCTAEVLPVWHADEGLWHFRCACGWEGESETPYPTLRAMLDGTGGAMLCDDVDVSRLLAEVGRRLREVTP